MRTGTRRAQAAGLVALIAASASFAGTAAAKNQPSTTYADKSGGYQITIPTAWKLVPRSEAQVKALIAQLKKKKAQVPLADVYASIIATAAGRSGLTTYRFQAFDWPVDGGTPILTQVSVGIVKGKQAFTASGLTSYGATYADAFAANKGAKVSVPKRVKLPAGPAELIEAIIPAGSGVSNGVELFLIPHGKKLYELSFQIDSSLLSSATLFGSIAQHFALT